MQMWVGIGGTIVVSDINTNVYSWHRLYNINYYPMKIII